MFADSYRWTRVRTMLAVTLLYTIGAVISLALPAPLHAETLSVGDLAPDFDLPGSDGAVHRLSDFRGEQVVVVAWFPKAYTSGCTIECKSLAQHGDKIRRFNVAYFMASVDPIADNVGFALDQKADFPLLSDENKRVAAAYGVLSPAGYAKRHTFYIGKDGRIMAIDRQVKPDTAAQDLVAMLTRLEVEPAVVWPVPQVAAEID